MYSILYIKRVVFVSNPQEKKKKPKVIFTKAE